MSADEAAAKAAWFAKQGPAAAKASHMAKQDQPAAAPAAPGASAPSWGTGMISMAGMCNGMPHRARTLTLTLTLTLTHP